MRFEQVLHAVGDLPYFDMQLLRTLFPAEARSLPMIVHRWKRAGRLLELRRGVYVLGEQYRRVAIHGAALAEAIYYPSYLSLEWALSWYGIIPEKAVEFTSVTPRERARFENAFGVFSYRTVKQRRFCGHRRERVMGAEVRLAEPEKALIDLWYLSAGEWTPQRMEAMRFDTRAIADTARLSQFAAQAGSPRLERAVTSWQEYAGSQPEETVIAYDQ